jgi:hypothetical protein
MREIGYPYEWHGSRLDLDKDHGIHQVCKVCNETLDVRLEDNWKRLSNESRAEQCELALRIVEDIRRGGQG